MDKKFCDICGKEIDTKLDRLGSIQYGYKSNSILPIGNQLKKGDTCENCIKRIDAFIKELKNGRT